MAAQDTHKVNPPDIPEHDLLRVIGKGAYGEVWLARNTLGTYRAVKVIYRASFDHDRPYERELRAIREVEPITRQHEGLVDILQVGERDDLFYYVMELADDVGGNLEIEPESYQAKTLSQVLHAQERLPVPQVLELGKKMASALAHLHEHQLVHRDVKLANLLYVQGRIKLADVGLVAPADASFSLVGTFGYIPREGPGRPAADIYALGKVLYELATGKDRADFPEVDVMDPALRGLNKVFLKACADEPNDRFRSATEMAHVLEQLETEFDEDGLYHPPMRATSKRAWIFLGIAVVVIGLAIRPGKKEPDPPPAGAVSERADPARVTEYSFGFKHVHGPGADRHVVRRVNMQKYSEWQDPPVTYWGPGKDQIQGLLTQKFSLAVPIQSGQIKAALASYNFSKKPVNVLGEGGGGCSLWASKDGTNWLKLADNPMPKELSSYLNYDQPLPSEVLGGNDLYIQFRAEAQGNELARYVSAQFGRSSRDSTNEVFRIDLNGSEP